MNVSDCEAFDGIKKAHHRDRLGYIALAAALPDLFLRDDWDNAQIIILLELLDDLELRDMGKLDIHEYQIGMVLSGKRQHLPSVFRAQGVVIMGFEKIINELHVERVVFQRSKSFFLLDGRRNRSIVE